MKRLFIFVSLLIVIMTITACAENPRIGSAITFGGLQWRILNVKGDKALLITEQVIEERPFHNDWQDTCWETCSLREYLNNEFYKNQFTPEEQARILETKNTNNKNPWYDTDDSNDTIDKVFLLSIDEVVKYFGDSRSVKNRKAWEINVSESNLETRELTYIESPYGYLINDKYNTARIATNIDGREWPWWLRTPGHSHRTAVDVNHYGLLVVGGKIITQENGGGRPALWVRL